MKPFWNWEWPQWTILGAMFGLSLWRWPLTSNRVPVHWGIDGQVDRYGGKFEGLLFLPLLSLFLYLLLLALPSLDPGRANYAQFAKPYRVLRIAILLFLLAMHSAILMVASGQQIDVSRVIFVATGVLFLAVGSMLGKTRPNWFVGIRNPWTLSSKTAWVKTHRAGGWTFLAMGLVQIVGALLLPSAATLALMMVSVLGATLGLSVYSYFIWRDADDKTPPANTLPAEDFAA